MNGRTNVWESVESFRRTHLTEAEAEAMVPHYGKRCRATLSMTRYRTLGRLSRPTYELVSLEEET